MTLRPLTPKEFSAALGGLRTPRWVRNQCRLFLADQKRKKPLGRGIRTITAAVPYLIPADELERFRPSLHLYEIRDTRATA